MRKEIKKRGEGGAIALTKQELKVNDMEVGEVVDAEITKIAEISTNNLNDKKEVQDVQ